MTVRLSSFSFVALLALLLAILILGSKPNTKPSAKPEPRPQPRPRQPIVERDPAWRGQGSAWSTNGNHPRTKAEMDTEIREIVTSHVERMEARYGAHARQ